MASKVTAKQVARFKAIRKNIAERNAASTPRAANDNDGDANPPASGAMHPRLLAMCIDAAGFSEPAAAYG